MSIENITEKILEDAKEHAEKVMADVKSQETSILENANKQAENILKSYTEKSLADAEIIKSRKISVAELESRKIKLGARQKAVSIAFDKAIDKIADFQDDKYIDFLVGMYEEVTIEGGEICLNEKDRQRVGEKLVAKINDGSQKEQVKLSEDRISARGGFILKKGSIEINATLETLINSLKEDATGQIAEILF
nr:V-type ATP synthase subunit E [uncultured Aminipila sp.]